MARGRARIARAPAATSVVADDEDLRRPNARIERQLRHGREDVVPKLGHFADAHVLEYAGVVLAPEIRQRLVRCDRNMRVERQPVDEFRLFC
jgi:hypothetical protein